MRIQRTFEVLDMQLDRCPTEQAVGYLLEGAWQYFSTENCRIQMLHYCGMLQDMGLKKGDLIAIVPAMVLPQWLFLDLAAQSLGIIVVAIHATSTAEQIEHILQESEVKFVFVLDQLLKDLVIKQEGLAPATFVRIDVAGNNKEFLNFCLAQADPITSDELKVIQDTIQTTDLATIIYTSGTTGVPKGVMLSHQNLTFNISTLLPLIPIKNGGRVLSFLPYSHIFERNTIFIYLAYGMRIHMVGNRQYFQESLRTVQPQFFTTVPRILEKIYDQVIAYQARQKWVNRQWLKWAIKVGSSDQSHLLARFQKFIVKYFIFGKLRRQLGGQLKAIVVGAAHLQPKLSYFFAAAGIKIREGYGMTETAPSISINRFQPGLYNYETVGLPVPGIEVKIHEPDESGEGEIVVKGPNVMMGYYKQPELTGRVLIDGGWLRTGDVGKWVKGRFLQITDRKKAIFKTSSGKYIAPLYLENHFKQSDFIDQIMVVGFNKPFLVALLIPNFKLLESWCLQEGIHWTSPQYMVLNLKVKELMGSEIERLNLELPNHQRIKKHHILAKEWTVETKQLSHTQKLLRSKIEEDYKKIIDRMY